MTLAVKVALNPDTTNQIQSTCRRQYNCDSKLEILFGRVEWGKGENDSYQHPPTPTASFCFQKSLPSKIVKSRDFVASSEPFSKQSRISTTLKIKPIENIVGKGEIAVNQHFLLFPQHFLPQSRQTL